MKRDCPRRHGSQGFGQAPSQSSMGQARTHFVPPPPVWVRGTSINPRVLYERLLPTDKPEESGHGSRPREGPTG